MHLIAQCKCSSCYCREYFNNIINFLEKKNHGLLCQTENLSQDIDTSSLLLVKSCFVDMKAFKVLMYPALPSSFTLFLNKELYNVDLNVKEWMSFGV